MKILTISGSARGEGNNARLLNQLDGLKTEIEFIHTRLLFELPLFTADRQNEKIPIVEEWRTLLSQSDGVIICTPEYLHNIPAALKNAMEWITSSGELVHKKVLAITLTPHAPRGEKAMQSLLWSLQALDAQVVASLSLYQSEINLGTDQPLSGEVAEMLNAALELF